MRLIITPAGAREYDFTPEVQAAFAEPDTTTFAREIDNALDQIQLKVSDQSLVNILLDSPWEQGMRSTGK